MTEDNSLVQKRLLINFDRYQRYKICSDFVKAVRDGGETFSVLEVGSGVLQELALFLPEDKIIFFDKSFPPQVTGRQEFVTGNATNLPFRAEAFDLVVSIDVYEHIPAPERSVYLHELLRCARRMVILAAPFADGLVITYEKLCHEYYKAIHGKEHPWLKEHLENGLPDLQQTVNFFSHLGCWVEVVPNGYLPHWLTMQIPYFLLLKNPSLNDLFIQLNAFYNQHCYPADNREPAYRKVLLVCKEQRDLKLVADEKKKILSFRLDRTFQKVIEETLNYLVGSFWYLYFNKAIR